MYFKIVTILLVSVLFSWVVDAQELKDDPYAAVCLEFSAKLNNDIEIAELDNFFNESLRTDSLLHRLEACRLVLKPNREKVHYYITRFHRPHLFFYNVHLHDPKTKESFGDLRIMFKNKNDYLIDNWMFLPKNDMEDDEIDIDAIPSVHRSN